MQVLLRAERLSQTYGWSLTPSLMSRTPPSRGLTLIWVTVPLEWSFFVLLRLYMPNGCKVVLNLPDVDFSPRIV